MHVCINRAIAFVGLIGSLTVNIQQSVAGPLIAPLGIINGFPREKIKENPDYEIIEHSVFYLRQVKHRKSGNVMGICTLFKIASKTFLTAAHCFDQPFDSTQELQIGRDANDGTKTWAYEWSIKDPKVTFFPENSNEGLETDIAILQYDEDVNGLENIANLPLSKQFDEFEGPFVMVGYGKHGKIKFKSGNAKQLKSSFPPLFYLATSKAKAVFIKSNEPGLPSSSHILLSAGSGTNYKTENDTTKYSPVVKKAILEAIKNDKSLSYAGVAQGDSGGPLLAKIGDQYQVIGVLSSAIDDDKKGLPIVNIYTVINQERLDRVLKKK